MLSPFDYLLSDPELPDEFPELALLLELPDLLDDPLPEELLLEDAEPDVLLLPPACMTQVSYLFGQQL